MIAFAQFRIAVLAEAVIPSTGTNQVALKLGSSNYQDRFVGSEITDIDIVRQTQTAVRGPDGENRFVTIVGSLKITYDGNPSLPEIYHCLIGPILEPHQVLGVSFLPSIAALEADLLGGAECSMDSYDAEFDADSGRVEISIEMRLSGAISVVTVVFSLMILAAA